MFVDTHCLHIRQSCNSFPFLHFQEDYLLFFAFFITLFYFWNLKGGVATPVTPPLDPPMDPLLLITKLATLADKSSLILHSDSHCHHICLTTNIIILHCIFFETCFNFATGGHLCFSKNFCECTGICGSGPIRHGCLGRVCQQSWGWNGFTQWS